MADQPDPPDNWRVYEGDPTPDPEPEAEPEAPADPPSVPYGNRQTYNPVFVTTSTSSGTRPRLIILMVAIAVLGVAVAGAIAIFSAVGDGGLGGIGGVDPKNPEDFAAMVEDLEEETGSTEVYSVGLYDGYAIIYTPVDDSDRSIAYQWDGGIEEWTKSTSSDARFDLADIDADLVEGMCDPVLEEVDGITPGDCYVFIRRPSPGSDGWFSAGASDEFGKYFSVQYDRFGVEVSRTQN